MIELCNPILFIISQAKHMAVYLSHIRLCTCCVSNMVALCYNVRKEDVQEALLDTVVLINVDMEDLQDIKSNANKACIPKPCTLSAQPLGDVHSISFLAPM